jgi:hypothetical protein
MMNGLSPSPVIKEFRDNWRAFRELQVRWIDAFVIDEVVGKFMISHNE